MSARLRCSMCKHTADLVLGSDGLMRCPAHQAWEAARQRIRTAVLEQTGSHAAIAASIDAAPRDVRDQCAKLIADGTLPRCPHKARRQR